MQPIRESMSITARLNATLDNMNELMSIIQGMDVRLANIEADVSTISDRISDIELSYGTGYGVEEYERGV